MDVVFERTGERSYAVEIRRPDAPAVRMDPAPGFDPLFPHDLQHLVVEEQLGLDNGIFGRLAKGGTASSFWITPVDRPRDKRAAARQRRKLARREAALAAAGDADDMARSERATYVAWRDWLAHCADRRLRAMADQMVTTAESIVARMGDDERSALEVALPRIRERITEVSDLWSATAVGGSIVLAWSPVGSRR